jgi:hypothetical protein
MFTGETCYVFLELRTEYYLDDPRLKGLILSYYLDLRFPVYLLPFRLPYKRFQYLERKCVFSPEIRIMNHVHLVTDTNRS